MRWSSSVTPPWSASGARRLPTGLQRSPPGSSSSRTTRLFGNARCSEGRFSRAAIDRRHPLPPVGQSYSALRAILSLTGFEGSHHGSSDDGETPLAFRCGLDPAARLFILSARLAGCCDLCRIDGAGLCAGGLCAAAEARGHPDPVVAVAEL